MIVVGRRVDQNLLGDRELPAVARHQRDGGGQIAPGGIADQRDFVGLHAEILRMQIDLPRRGIAILQPHGEEMLRRKAVFHGGHPAARIARQ